MAAGRRPSRPALLLAAALVCAAGSARADDSGEDGAPGFDPIGVIERQPLVPPEPDLLDRLERQAVRAWDAVPEWQTVKATAGEAVDAAGEALRPVAVAVDPALTRVEEAAGQAWHTVRSTGAGVADTVMAEASELRQHPMVRTLSDLGGVFRAIEAIGITALAAGLAWRKIRG